MTARRIGGYASKLLEFSLFMGWRHVLFANWPVDPDVVRPHVPDALKLDTYEGRAWLSVVPFTNVDVWPHWAPELLGFRLPELNLRTYITHEDNDGVYFFSLDADGVLGVLGARLFHSLPYYYARMSLRETEVGIRFESHRFHPGARPVHFDATYGAAGSRLDRSATPLADFLVERYRYYTEAPSGALRYAVVDHELWPLYDANVTFAENTLFEANGFAVPASDPVHFYSPGVDTIASPNKRA